MNLTNDELKALLAKCDPFAEAAAKVVGDGVLRNCEGQEVPYRVLHGWNVSLANLCDETWGAFNNDLMRFVAAQNYSEAKLVEILDRIQIDDGHWRWLDKARYYTNDQYHWFFLEVNRAVEAACLIYQPKPSALDGASIFYIEYVATAPWNRDNPMSPRRLQKVGTKIITCASLYATNVLKLRPGFSLHSLPKAEGFYRSLGMLPHPPLDKEGLRYFEMPQASSLVGEGGK